MVGFGFTPLCHCCIDKILHYIMGSNLVGVLRLDNPSQISCHLSLFHSTVCTLSSSLIPTHSVVSTTDACNLLFLSPAMAVSASGASEICLLRQQQLNGVSSEVALQKLQ